MKLFYPIMAIDTYGLPSEQYEEFFEKNVRLAAKLYLKTCSIFNEEGAGHVDFKTILDIYQETVYAAGLYGKAEKSDSIRSIL